jgi:hypothetical protein
MADNMKQFSEETKKFLAYDKAIANLKEAGLADVFIRAIEKDPEVMKAVEKLTPANAARLTRAGWSCCVTVEDPL